MLEHTERKEKNSLEKQRQIEDHSTTCSHISNWSIYLQKKVYAILTPRAKSIWRWSTSFRTYWRVRSHQNEWNGFFILTPQFYLIKHIIEQNS